MSAFASKVTQTVPISGVEGQTAVIRKLGWKALELARSIVTQKATEMVKAIGWAEIQKSVTGMGGEAAVTQKAAGDPFLQHDRLTLLERGLVSWTLSDKPTAAELEDLDEAAAVGLARAIYDLSRPKTEAEQKNG